MGDSEIRAWDTQKINESRREVKANLFQCDFCHKTLSSKSSLKNHLNCHSNKKAFCCEHCGKLFSFKNNLFSHLVTEHKLYEHLALHCEQCGKIFARKNTLSTHMLTHEGVRPFPCHICLKKFSQKVTRDVHLVTHTGNYKFDCARCSRKFSTKHKLKVHLRSHSAVKETGALKLFHGSKVEASKRYACTVLQCPGKVKSFSDKNLFVKHNQRYHNANKQYFSCHDCGFQFVERSSLKHHIAINHAPEGLVMHSCFFCDKRYTLKSKLKRHVKIHLEEPQYRCQTCGKRYYRADALKKHETHHRITSTACRICEKDCRDAIKLSEHVKLHVSADHSCLQCGLTFTTRTALDYHTAKHENKFSFTCPVCAKRFVRKCHFTAHLTTHNPSNVKCRHCDKFFKCESYMRRHVTRMHDYEKEEAEASSSHLDELEEIIDSRTKVCEPFKSELFTLKERGEGLESTVKGGRVLPLPSKANDAVKTPAGLELLDV